MDRLGTVLGQQIVPVDEPGASGAIAAHAASDAIPDGSRSSHWRSRCSSPCPARRRTFLLCCRAISFRSPRSSISQFHLRERCLRHQNAAGSDRARRRTSQSNFFCGDRHRKNNAPDRPASAKPGRYQIAGRALHRRPAAVLHRPRGRNWPRPVDHCKGYSGLAGAIQAHTLTA